MANRNIAFFFWAFLCLCMLASCGRDEQQDDPPSAEEFYRGNSIHFLIYSAAGTPNDQIARIIAQHLGKHIPGQPTIVPRNMPGASGMIMANYLYNVAPQDGTYLGQFSRVLPLMQAMHEPAVEFDASKFYWLGSAESTTHLLMTWHTTGITSIDDARSASIDIGVTSPGDVGANLANIANAVLGTRFNTISGYQGGPQITLAMEQGEVQGRVAAITPFWLNSSDVTILLQAGVSRPELPQVPNLEELVEREENRRLVRFLITAPYELGRPVVTTPNVPADRRLALRRGFEAMLEDPEFRADAQKRQIDLFPVTGDKLERIIEDILATPQSVIDSASRVVGAG